MDRNFDYTGETIVSSLREAGVEEGDVLFCHLSVGRLGRPAGEFDVETVSRMMLAALRTAVGPAGTLVLPSYSYSMGRNEIFDVEKTPGTVGAVCEYFRRQPATVRSADPMLAVCAQGPSADALVRDLPWTCYGQGSVYDRLRACGAKICTIGLPLHWATFRHHIEEMAGVPFRFQKLFTGQVLRSGDEAPMKQTWSYLAAVLQDCCAPDGWRLQEMVRASGACRVVPLGRSEVWCIEAETYFQRGLEAMRKEPWLSAKGPARSRDELIVLEDARVGSRAPAVDLPSGASAAEVVRVLAPLRRDLVSAGFDAALEALADLVPMKIHKYPSGTPCFGWVVPEKWTCTEAWIERLDGTRLLDYEDLALHVLSGSQPFDGEISREELLAHLHVHPALPEAVPFVYSYFHRRWGLCASQKFRDSLKDERYRVCVRAGTSFGNLCVGECVVPGEVESGFVLCAHLDHPGQANDGLSGVAVGIEVMRRLRVEGKLRHTVRLLVLSETFGSLAWLSDHGAEIPGLKAGLFLEMLGLDAPHALQHSLAKSTCWDARALDVLKARDAASWEGDFLRVITNDDRQFNAPGIRVPMLSLSRVLNVFTEGNPVFPEYHTHLDNFDLVHPVRLEDSVEATLQILRSWDEERTPVPNYCGEPCLTRAGLEPDFFARPELSRQLYDVMHALDGRTTLNELSARLGMDVGTLSRIVGELSRAGLVTMQ